MNIVDIQTLLQSTKAKEKNEGIDLLTQVSFKSLAFKEYNDLIKITLRLISNEKSDKSNRRKRASYCIRTIIETVISKHPKATSFINHVIFMIDNCDANVFIDFLKSIDIILCQQYIKDHLNSENWSQIFLFLSNSLGNTTYDNEVMNCLGTLIYNNSINYLAIYYSDYKALVRKLRLFESCSDSRIINTLLKLSNRLIMVFACRDFTVVDDLIKMTFVILTRISYNFNNIISLNDQIVIFLNLDMVHTYLQNISTVSTETSGGNYDVINHISLFLDTIINNLVQTKLISVNHIGIVETYNHKFDWFRLASVYYKKLDPLWLLVQGISKLLRSFFSLRGNCLSAQVSSSEEERVQKRRKMAFFVDHSCFLEFINNFNLSTKQRIIGLQLLTFQLELAPLITLDSDPSLAGSTLLDSYLNVILTSLNDPALIRWNLIVINSLLTNMLRFPSEICISSDQVIHILKITLPLLKSTDLCDISSILLYKIVQIIQRQNLAINQDNLLTTSVQSIIDLPDISGPAKLNNPGMKACVAIINLLAILGRDINVREKIIHWIESKWDQVFTGKTFGSGIELFPNFIQWLQTKEWMEFSLDFTDGELLEQEKYMVSFGLMKGFNHLLDFLSSRFVAESLPVPLKCKFLKFFEFDNFRSKFMVVMDSLTDPVDITKFNMLMVNLGIDLKCEMPKLIDGSTLTKVLAIADVSAIIPLRYFNPEVFIKESSSGSYLDEEFTQNKVQSLLTADELDRVDIDEKVYCLIKLFELDYNCLKNKLSDWFKSLDQDEVVYGLYKILQHDVKCNKELIYILGLGPLSNSLYERNELIILVVCKVIMSYQVDDVSDMINWIIMVGDKKLILTTYSSVWYLQMLLHLMKQDIKPYYDRFMDYFEYVTSDVRIRLIPAINDFMVNISSKTQFEFYKGLIRLYNLESKEQIIEYCIILGSLTTMNLRIVNSVIFNLLELGSLGYLDWINKSFTRISEFWKVNFNNIFDNSKLDVLQSWWIHHHNFLKFPYELLGFDTDSKFYEYYAVELIAVVSSYNQPDFSFIELFDRHQLVDAISLAIPLAYTANGMRHEIDDVFKTLLKDSFKEQRQVQLDNLILECLRLLDVSDSISITKSMDIDYSFETLENPFPLSLSFSTGFKLMTSLINKYYVTNYWTTSRVYFMIKRLTIDLDNCFTNTQKRTILRKIFMVMTFGKQNLCNIPLINLVNSKILSVNFPERIGILTLFSIRQWIEKWGSNIETDKLIAYTLYNLLDEKECNQRLIKDIIAYDSSNAAFFRVVCKSLLGHSSPCTKIKIHEISKFVNNGSFEIIIRLISFVYNTNTLIEHDKELVEALMVTDMEDYPLQTKIWATNLIAQDYFDNGLEITDNYVQLSEFKDIRVLSDVLEEIVSIINQFRHDDNSKISSLADITMGFIINQTKDYEKFNNDEILLFSNNYQRYFSASGKLMLNIQHECHSLLNELCLVKGNPVLPIIKQFGIQVPQFSLKAFPYIVIYFLETCPTKYNVIVTLIENFFNQTITNKQTTEVFLKSILLLRTLKGSIFRDVYSKINMNKVCEIACRFNYFETSLLLLEESQIGNPNWYQYDYVTDIFESIYAEDLIRGLPQETTLEYAMKSIFKNSQSSEKSQYLLGEFNSNVLFGHTVDRTSLVSGMLQDGLNGLASMIGGNDDIHEWSWKLSNWDLPTITPSTCNEFIYNALKAISNYEPYDSLFDDLMRVKTTLKKRDNPKKFHELAQDYYQSVFNVCRLRQTIPPNPMTGTLEAQDILFDKIPFNKIENTLLAQSIALQTMSLTNDTNKEFYISRAIRYLMTYNDLAIKDNQQQKMINSIFLIDRLTNQTIAMKDQLEQLSKFQTAKTLWKQNHFSMAIDMMKTVKGTLNPTTNLINSILVGWLADSRQELPNQIMEKYVISIDETHNVNEDPLRSQIYYELGQFCEKQGKANELDLQLNKIETQYKAKRKELDDIKDHYSKVSVQSEEKKQVQKYYAKLKGQYQNELEYYEELKHNKVHFINRATEYYLKSETDDSVDKFFSLWLEDPNKDELNKVIDEILESVPSHKLTGWIPQLISRLLEESNSFQEILAKIIKRVCIDHPYLSLYPLFSLLFNSMYVDDNNMLMISKVKAADKLIQSLALGSNLTYLLQVFNPIKLFCQECLSLSKYKQKGRFINVNKVKELDYWVNNLPAIPSPILKIPPSSTSSLRSQPLLLSIEPMITIASSGLSLPKIVSFNLSNGTQQKVLFKYGTDDLRQDSIMEQVFEKVNLFFIKDKETRSRNLNVRTYQIVPIGPKSGIIEFVANSTALIDIIKPYHSKDSMKIDKAKELMKQCQNNNRDERIKVYKKITHQIHPVLRLFFFDTFLQPNDWFSSKLKYSRGLAASSIVGYILGLGDRHCNNILIDELTGEPIHIDLGVAFDQGTRLPIPETVPFRLTRDLVDGLGITGVEGIFRENCQHTLRVLRQNQDHIKSILEILRYDPLYSWSLSPLRKARLQVEGELFKDSDQDISEAGQAVQKVQDKLRYNGLNEEAAVRELISTATNEENLALIYCGWTPFY